MDNSKLITPKMIRTLINVLAENIARILPLTLWDDCVDLLMAKLEQLAVNRYGIQGAKYEFRGYVKRNILRRESNSRLIVTPND